jgi:hypothetical protein
MHPRTAEILSCLESELTQLRSAVDAVPAHRRSERPRPGRWSVAEVLEHLAMVEKAMLKACTRQLAAARESGLPPETDCSSIINALPPSVVANRERLIAAPERLLPTGVAAEIAWAEIEATRVQFIEFVTSCDGLALGQVSFPHPALGPLNMYQWLLFAAGHHARHAAQIREIATELDRRVEDEASAIQEPSTTA